MPDPQTPIADLGLLGDGHTAALVGRDGTIEWWCAPRFDSRSVFARLLDPGAGHWAIRPSARFTATRAYVPGTLVLRTELVCATGRVRLTDALALAPGARGHAVGLEAPHLIARMVEGLDGEVEVAVELAPRPEYGLVAPRWERASGGGLRSVGGADTVTVRSDRELSVDDATVRGALVLRPGESAGFTLAHHSGLLAVDGPPPPAAADVIADTIAGWRSWSDEHTAYDGAYVDEVRRSSLVLHALTYGPTGAVVAAPTTSLPERLGGDANWDYRFAWLRDASFTLRALWVGACPDEAERYVEFMARAAHDARGDRLQIMFGVDGERDLTERELDHLAGYGGSRPVRVGNAAWRQRQLDVHGEVLDAAWTIRDRLGGADEHTLGFLRSAADLAATTWTLPDAGIWEGREGERHYLSAKLMSWVALDRAVRLGDRLGPGADPGRWAAARDLVRTAILREGLHPDLGVFTGAFGSNHLDASALLVPIVGFLPGDDPRVRRTVDRIADELADGALVRRWTGTEEGGFVLASGWLVEALALAGEVDRARTLFEELLGWANDLGLLSEVFDPGAGGLIGNFPQAFSHIGVVNAAWAITQAERQPARTR